MESTSLSAATPSKEEVPVEDTSTEDADTETEGLQSEEETEELSPESKEGFHKKLTQKDKELKEAQRKADEASKELEEIREKERLANLAKMSDTERLQAERDEAVAKAFKLEINHFILKEVTKRKLDVNDPLIEMVIDTPWAIPPIRRILGDSPMWDDLKREVEDKLPSYLDSLVTRKSGETKGTGESTSEESEIESIPTAPSVDTERTAGGVPDNRKVWSQREIAKMDAATYAKYKPLINKALAEGRIVP